MTKFPLPEAGHPHPPTADGLHLFAQRSPIEADAHRHLFSPDHFRRQRISSTMISAVVSRFRLSASYR